MSGGRLPTRHAPLAACRQPEPPTTGRVSDRIGGATGGRAGGRQWPLTPTGSILPPPPEPRALISVHPPPHPTAKAPYHSHPWRAAKITSALSPGGHQLIETRSIAFLSPLLVPWWSWMTKWPVIPLQHGRSPPNPTWICPGRDAKIWTPNKPHWEGGLTGWGWVGLSGGGGHKEMQEVTGSSHELRWPAQPFFTCWEHGRPPLTTWQTDLSLTPDRWSPLTTGSSHLHDPPLYQASQTH